jgi:hypothetical protein
MKYIRILLLIYAGISMVGGYVLWQQTKGTGNLLGAIYLLFNAVVVILSLKFEKKRYKNKNGVLNSDWKETKESYIDSSSGKLMQVYYNPKTGERSYREAKSKNENG